MDRIFGNVVKSLQHITSLDNTFNDNDIHPLYVENRKELSVLFSNSEDKFIEQFYGKSGRQMILADIIEYIFTGRGYHFIDGDRDKLSDYLKMIMYFTNILMYYESMTVESKSREKFLELLSEVNPAEKEDEIYGALLEYNNIIGLPIDKISNDFFTDDFVTKFCFEDKIKAKRELNKYFDSLLPKTAGGLWHELLVYAFLLRFKVGHIIPLLLTQRFLHGNKKHIVPPDFLILTDDKRLYGVEVGTGKEGQSGLFSLETAIPTVTIDTQNSRSSDRCPICKKWIMFCDQIINDFSNMDFKIEKEEFKCLEYCKKYSAEEIASGCCPYTKYKRSRIKREDTHHCFTDNLHYHYQCVLNNVDSDIKDKIIEAQDNTALKTHYPFYDGLSPLLKK